MWKQGKFIPNKKPLQLYLSSPAESKNLLPIPRQKTDLLNRYQALTTSRELFRCRDMNYSLRKGSPRVTPFDMLKLFVFRSN